MYVGKMVHLTRATIPWPLIVGLGSAYVVSHAGRQNKDTSPSLHMLARRDDSNAADFSWIRRWAAVGDSFTAGIGAGNQLGAIFHRQDDWLCSRHDQAYPIVLNKAFGPAVQDFQYMACSGDRSEQIYTQVDKMDGDLDLVIMTAGGNDLCLVNHAVGWRIEQKGKLTLCTGIYDQEMHLHPVSPIEPTQTAAVPAANAHIRLSWSGTAVCEEVINTAQKNIDTILKPNLKSILLHMNSKMKKDAVVVYNGYAQFFNTDDEDTCGKNQDWTFPNLVPWKWGSPGIPLDVARRKRFNSLVIEINDAIKDVVEDVKKNGNIHYHIGVADWDPWVWKGVRGQFCDPKGEGFYPEKNQPDLHFFKPNTHRYNLGEKYTLCLRKLPLGHELILGSRGPRRTEEEK